jgi:hypothetical protein
MSYPLPDEIKQHARALCGNGRLDVLDPGEMLKTDDGKWLVSVVDTVTGQFLWLEIRVPVNFPPR